MKRNSLTTALLAGLAGAAGLASTATAVNINPDGLGQVLVYPYYTVNGGNQTLVSVVNTTNRVKAVKVRFVEGRNSKEVLDFNLYLSPFDVWAAAVFGTDPQTGAANMIFSDTSCTVPILRNITVPFRNYQYSGSNQDHPDNDIALLSSLERTREGHLEMIEMGLLQTGTVATQLAEEATHNSAGIPTNCQALVNAWTPPTGGWFINGAANIDTPAGGLYGAGAIVDTANGTMLAYNADAIEGFYTDSTAPGALHAAPGTVDPDLRDADNGTVVNAFVFSQNGASVIQEVFPVGLTTPDAVSLVYMHDAIYNEYNTEASLGASSEWVITMPTKRYYVDVDADIDVIDPFTEAFRDDGSACEEISIEYFDREEQRPGTPPGSVDVSPPPPDITITGPSLCWEANVVSFNQSAVANGGESAILGSDFAFNLNTTASATVTFTTGWLRMGFDDPTTVGPDNVLTVPDGSQYFGLPVTGFWAANFVNSAAQPGLLATYSGAFKHRASRANSG